MAERSGGVGRVVLSYVLGFIVLFALAYIAITYPLTAALYTEFVTFFRGSLLLIVSIGLFAFIAELFGFVKFPLNLPGPLFKSGAGVLVAYFIVQVLTFMEGLLNLTYMDIVSRFALAVYITVGLIILVIEYVRLLSGAKTSASEAKKDLREHSREDEAVSWNDIHRELKGAAYNVSTRLRKVTEHTEKKVVRKKSKL